MHTAIRAGFIYFSVANLVCKFVYRNGKTVRLLIIFDEMEKNNIQKLVRSKSERVTFES